MKQVSNWPALGLGTWRMGENARMRRAEVAAVRQALDIGYRLIDSAEMYGDGGAEEVVGVALAEALRAGDCKREELTIVSKVFGPTPRSDKADMQVVADSSVNDICLNLLQKIFTTHPTLEAETVERLSA